MTQLLHNRPFINTIMMMTRKFPKNGIQLKHLSTAICKIQAGGDSRMSHNCFILSYNRQLKLKLRLQARFFNFVELLLWKHAATFFSGIYDEIGYENWKMSAFFFAAIL